MSFIALLTAILLGYHWKASHTDWLKQMHAPYASLIERSLNDGEAKHGAIAWMLAVLLPVITVAAAYIVLLQTNIIFALVFSILVLLLSLRAGQFGKRSEALAQALREQNVDEARRLLAAWQQNCEAENLDANQIAKVGIESALQKAHYNLFAPIFWFVLLGPAGALLYRLTLLTRDAWNIQPKSAFQGFVSRMFGWLDWLPIRFTAGSFAIVGNFEDAVYCWRTQATAWADASLGIILASGAGALGVRLGEPIMCKGVVEFRPEIGLGDNADADYLMSTVGLIWRALVLMVGLLLLLTFANWLGS